MPLEIFHLLNRANAGITNLVPFVSLVGAICVYE